jgi:hypothetical protein
MLTEDMQPSKRFHSDPFGICFYSPPEVWRSGKRAPFSGSPSRLVGRIARSPRVVVPTSLLDHDHRLYTFVFELFLARRFAHCHSASQFLRHLPWHWNSHMRPPHCGHTKFIIDDMSCAFGSPGNLSAVLIMTLSCEEIRPTHEAQPRARTMELCRTDVCALSRALRTGWLRSPSRPA